MIGWLFCLCFFFSIFDHSAGAPPPSSPTRFPASSLLLIGLDSGASFVEKHVSAVRLFEGEIHELVGELIVSLGGELAAEALARDLVRVERLDFGVVEKKPSVPVHAAAFRAGTTTTTTTTTTRLLRAGVTDR